MFQEKMTRDSRIQVTPWLQVLLLVVVGVLLRLAVADIPNFAPVAGLALFAGWWIPSRGLALLVPLLVMVTTDWLLGGYQPLLRVTVYAALAAPVLLRSVIARSVPQPGRNSRYAWAELILSLAVCSLGASVLFFVTTNLSTWAVTDWYPRSWSGLTSCYVQALPFFRHTVLGDLAFTACFFGCYGAGVLAVEGLQRRVYARG